MPLLLLDSVTRRARSAAREARTQPRRSEGAYEALMRAGATRECGNYR